MNKTFIIAELSANHNHDKQVALDTIRAAKRCGADAVKIQTYTADTMTIDSNQEWFKIHGTIWNGENLYHLYQKAYTPWEWHEEIFHVAKEEGLVFLPLLTKVLLTFWKPWIIRYIKLPLSRLPI